jgi:hypothetical protein
MPVPLIRRQFGILGSFHEVHWAAIAQPGTDCIGKSHFPLAVLGRRAVICHRFRDIAWNVFALFEVFGECELRISGSIVCSLSTGCECGSWVVSKVGRSPSEWRTGWRRPRRGKPVPVDCTSP